MRSKELSDRFKQVMDDVADGNLSEFSRRVGASVSTVQNYSEGTWPKFADFLLKLSNSCNVSLQWLLTGSGEPYALFFESKKYLDLKVEQLEETILNNLQKISKIFELRSVPEFEEMRCNYLIELIDNQIVFLRVDLSFEDNNFFPITNRMGLLAFIYGKTYLKIDIKEKEMIKFISGLNSEHYRGDLEKIKKFDPTVCDMNSEQINYTKHFYKNSKSKVASKLVRSILELMAVGSEMDIRFVKEFIDRETKRINQENDRNSYEKKRIKVGAEILEKLNDILKKIP